MWCWGHRDYLALLVFHAFTISITITIAVERRPYLIKSDPWEKKIRLTRFGALVTFILKSKIIYGI